jgi:hypothetical protein
MRLQKELEDFQGKFPSLTLATAKDYEEELENEL